MSSRDFFNGAIAGFLLGRRSSAVPGQTHVIVRLLFIGLLALLAVGVVIYSAVHFGWRPF